MEPDDGSLPGSDAAHDAAPDAASEDDGGSGPSDAAQDAADPDAAVAPSFTDVYAILDEHCAYCHRPDPDGPGEQQAGIGYLLGRLDMSTAELAYRNLVEDGGFADGIHCGPEEQGDAGLRRVVPSDTANSLILSKLSDAPKCGVRMPDGLPPLPAEQIAVISAWIEAGAKND
jgi:hypothetical protein